MMETLLRKLCVVAIILGAALMLTQCVTVKPIPGKQAVAVPAAEQVAPDPSVPSAPITAVGDDPQHVFNDDASDYPWVPRYRPLAN